jgi:hypothetical protein
VSIELMSAMSRGRSAGAGFIVIRPSVKVNSVESDATTGNWNLHEVGADLRVERALVHPEIGRCIPHSDKTWCNHGDHD